MLILLKKILVATVTELSCPSDSQSILLGG